jgi:hypothetical protein
LPAIDAWQSEVGNDNVKGELAQPLERRFTGCRLFDAVPRFAQALRNHFAEAVLIVDEQQVLERPLRHR